jgi:hypothetical protein
VTDVRGTVTLRASWWLRLGGALAFVMGGGLWLNLLGLVDRGAPEDGTVVVTGVLGIALTVVIGFVATVLVLAGLGSWRFRQTVGPREATVRILFGTTRISRDRAERIRLDVVTVHAGRAGGRRPVVRVLVEGPDQRGLAARVGVDATMTRSDAAIDVLAGWARDRPGLVTDDATRELVGLDGPPGGGC